MASEDLPWFVWEEVVSFLDRQERWRLLTLSAVWRDKIAADSRSAVKFRSAPRACPPRGELHRNRQHVRSIDIFSIRNVDESEFLGGFPKLRHLFLGSGSLHQPLIDAMVEGPFSECFNRLTYLAIHDPLPPTVLAGFLSGASRLKELWLDLNHPDAGGSVVEGLACGNLTRLHIKLAYLELGVFKAMAEQLERLQDLHVNFSDFAPRTALTRRHLPRGLRSLFLRSTAANEDAILLDLEATKDLRVLHLGVNVSFSRAFPQALQELSLKGISAASASGILSNFRNASSLHLNCIGCSPGMATKLVYGLAGIRALRIENLLDHDALFDGPVLESVTQLSLHSKMSGGNALGFILRAFPNLHRLTVAFPLPMPGVLDHLVHTRIMFLTITKRQCFSAYDMVARLCSALVSLSIPKKDLAKYSRLPSLHPTVTFRGI